MAVSNGQMIRTLVVVLVLVGANFGAVSAHALEFFGGADLAVASGNIAVSSQESGTQMLITTVGASFGLKVIKSILLGGRSAYSMIEQTSDPTATTGNRRGAWLMPVAPIIGFEHRKFLVLAEYDFMGDYRLATKNSSGEEIIYKKPSGVALEFLYRLNEHWSVGIKYQQVSFAQEQTGTASPVDLAQPLSMTKYGGIVDVRF